MNAGGSLERSRALALIDSAVEGHLALAATLQYGLAGSQAEREAVYRLRYEAVMARGWARQEDFPDQRESDSYDGDATHIVARDGAVLAGTARLVFPRAARRLPAEEAFDLEIPPKGQVVAWDRTVIARAYRCAAHEVLWGLLCTCWLETRQAGYSEVSGVLSRSMLKLYRSMGVEFVAIGPGHIYWNEERFPCKFDAIASAGGIAHSLDLLASKKEIS